jgi:hypothetical protein
MITIDTETVGLNGQVILVQYAIDGGDIILYCPWTEPVSKTIALYEMFATHEGGLLFFNAVFDWFMIYKQYCIFKLLAEIDENIIPEDFISTDMGMNQFIDLEDKARDYPNCLKPVKVCDLLLHARKTLYQSTMDRKNITIKKVPTELAWVLAEELEKRVPFKDIYFARRKDKHQPKWQIQDRLDIFGDVDPHWKNVIVRFKPSAALKALAVDALNIPEDEILKYGDISPKLHPVEFGYAPYAKAAIKIKLKNKSKEKSRAKWKYRGTWPDFIKRHITHWGYNEEARKYAKNDIVYTRALYKYFGRPAFGDDDSELACAVAVSRWRGFPVDLDGIRELKRRAEQKKVKLLPDGRIINLPTAPRAVKAYILEVCDPVERLAMTQEDLTSTKKVTLENLVKDEDGVWNIPCPECIDFTTGQLKENYGHCSHCKDKAFVPHQAKVRAQEVLDVRKAAKEIELYDKLLAAGRLHASFKIIGALSSRMSGADGLNPQGIKKTKEVKSRFLLAHIGFILCGGDFDAFEITIAEALYNDPELRKDLLTCEKCNEQMIFNQKKVDYLCKACSSNKGKKIHALFGVFVFPEMSYEQIKETDGSANDIYTKCKSAVFAMLYGGTGYTLQTRLGVPIEVADEAVRKFARRYKGVGKVQERIKNMFESMRQPGGRGSKVEWHDPAEKIETMFGFPRFFTMENRVAKALYDLANRMPPGLKNLKLKVVRTDREQFASGAACSAIYSAAFTIQSHNKRAAGNHEIQGTGAQATKKVQRKIWEVQPSGVHPWLVTVLNIHDSIMGGIHPDYVKQVEKIVHDTVEEIRKTIPLIKMPWESYLANWADKGGPICSCVINDHDQIVKAYKNRDHVVKDKFNRKKVHRVLAKQEKTYKGLSWRLMTDDEIKLYWGPVISFDLETKKVISYYPNRDKLDNLDPNLILECVKGKLENYNGLGWRLANKNEIREAKEAKAA